LVAVTQKAIGDFIRLSIFENSQGRVNDALLDFDTTRHNVQSLLSIRLMVESGRHRGNVGGCRAGSQSARGTFPNME